MSKYGTFFTEKQCPYVYSTSDTMLTHQNEGQKTGATDK
jgi:hypothetical protein